MSCTQTISAEQNSRLMFLPTYVLMETVSFILVFVVLDGCSNRSEAHDYLVIVPVQVASR